MPDLPIQNEDLKRQKRQQIQSTQRNLFVLYRIDGTSVRVVVFACMCMSMRVSDKQSLHSAACARRASQRGRQEVGVRERERKQVAHGNRERMA